MHAIVFGWTVCQLPLTLLFVVNSQDQTAEFFTLSYNTTITVTSKTTSLVAVHVGLAFLVMLFGMLAMQIKQSDAMDSMTEYSDALIQTFSSWNIALWTIFVLFHVLLIMTLASPVDLYCIGFICIGQFITIHYMCKPRDMYKGAENIALLIFFCMYLLLYNETKQRSGTQLTLLSSAAIIDLLLVTGHVYDENTNASTVSNCRLFYVCFVAALNLSMFFF